MGSENERSLSPKLIAAQECLTALILWSDDVYAIGTVSANHMLIGTAKGFRPVPVLSHKALRGDD